MKKNIKKSYIVLSLVLAVLLTACSKGENDLNEEITVSESASDSADETKSETTTAEAETSFETTAAEPETSTEAANLENKQSSASESEEESVSESDMATEEEENDTSESTSAVTTEATVVVTAASTEAEVAESEQTNVTESETVTEEETSETEESVSKELAVLKSAVSLHELHKEEDKAITLEADEYETSFPTDMGWFVPFTYEDTRYVCKNNYEFISDANRNVTVFGEFEDKIDDFMMNFDKLEYVGMIGETNLQAVRLDEADVYRYEDNLIIIYNEDWYPLYVWGFREQFYGFSFDENNKIGNDPEKLREALLERGIEYDPSVFLCALLYVKSDR